MPLPVLETDRLTLRSFTTDDALRVRTLAGEKAIAAVTALIPHPYPDGAAEEWIATHEPEFAAGKSAQFALTVKATGELIGAMGLIISAEHRHAELGYWVGVPYWGQGYATEAAGRILAFGFEKLDLIRIHAHHYAHNPASGRVMEKLGMQREGVLRQHVVKWGAVYDVVLFGILREEWEHNRANTARPERDNGR